MATLPGGRIVDVRLREGSVWTCSPAAASRATAFAGSKIFVGRCVGTALRSVAIWMGGKPYASSNAPTLLRRPLPPGRLATEDWRRSSMSSCWGGADGMFGDVTQPVGRPAIRRVSGQRRVGLVKEPQRSD
jgi:hypothetical protein